ncbi:hypothetical protein E3N88_38578 [Mikania micrantha]|uniref:Uncharacterized protein n=1 Tax=Mikania micrantha TaxID=192012 RepID=A0A5N6LUG1_9ASTR|nr:hypothetical protein E3N88_38578 [Mikania micrantha]
MRETELRIVRNRETKENFKIWNFGLVAVRDEEVEDPSRRKFIIKTPFLSHQKSPIIPGIVSTSSDHCFAVKTPSD